MTIGEKNRRISFYAPSTELDDENLPVEWEFVKARWANIVSETGMGRIRSEASAGGINTDLRKYSFRIAYDLTIDTTMQIRDSMDVRYDVVTVLHDHATRKHTDVVAQVGGSNG